MSRPAEAAPVPAAADQPAAAPAPAKRVDVLGDLIRGLGFGGKEG